jgi:hypothetical protein
MKFIFHIRVVIAALVLAASLSCPAQVSEVSNDYGIKISVPVGWQLDTAQVRNAKVALAELLTAMKSDGKVRILNTGTPPASQLGYARVRLNITADLSLSQAEVMALTDQDLAELGRSYSNELMATPLARVEKDSISVTRTRTDDGYLGIRLSYIRSGLNGPVQVHQYWFPFSNRAAQLTLSHEVAKKDTLWPVLLRVLASLRLADEYLWPKGTE